jgi:anti-sigma regulatory factor (Ser/Thr protein kinase)
MPWGQPCRSAGEALQRLDRLGIEVHDHFLIDGERSPDHPVVKKLASVREALFDLCAKVRDVHAGPLVPREPEMTRQAYPIAEAVARVLARLRPGIAGKSLAVEMDVADEGTVTTYQPQMGHVVEEMLHNAVEASPAGGVIRIAVRTGDDGWTLHLRVEDQGVLDPAARELLNKGEPLGREAGRGYGLSLMQGVANDLGAHLQAEAVDTGTAVLLRVPFAREDRSARGIGDKASA